MLNKHQHSITKKQSDIKLAYSFARSESEILEAQRLRYKVFADEMGANIGSDRNIDQDGFDNFCDHLIIRNLDTGEVVGTYRILNPMMASEAGGYYSAGEFDIERLNHILDNTVEVGRACVHPEYRNGSVITLLWAGLAKYMKTHNYQYMIGCASVSMLDGGHQAASLYRQLTPYMAPPEYRVFPHCPLPLESLQQNLKISTPALIKGYLRLGAYICGEPAWDPNFNSADMFILLPIARLNQRYFAHFFR